MPEILSGIPPDDGNGRTETPHQPHTVCFGPERPSRPFPQEGGFYISYIKNTTAIALVLATSLLIILLMAPASDADTKVEIDDLGYILHEDGTAEVFNCCDLTGDVTVPASVNWDGRDYTVTSVGSFSHSGITGITIPDSVRTIGSMAFFDCDNLVSVSLGANIVSIGDDAFFSCDGLRSIDLPGTIETIGESAFCGSSLDSTTVPSSNQHFRTVDGVLFSKDGTRLLTYPGMKSDSTYNVPSEVRSIDRDAFYGNFFLKELHLNEGLTYLYSPVNNCNIEVISLPSTLESVKGYLINNGCRLTTISLSKDNTHFTVQEGILYDAPMRKVIEVPTGIRYGDLIIPEGVEELGSFSIDSISADSVTLPSTLKRIGSCAFGYSEIDSITIPGSVTSIGSSAFAGSNLKEVTFLGVPDRISYNAFGVRSDVLTEYYTVDPVPLEDYVQMDTAVTYIHLDSGPETAYSVNIDGLTYDLRPNLNAKLVGFEGTEITIPGKVTYKDYDYTVTSIQSRLFARSDITLVSIPGTVSEIGDDLFWHCYYLQSVDIGEGVTTIGSFAFSFCYALGSIVLPSTLENIGEQPFYGCESLETISISGSNQHFTVIDNVLFSKNMTVLYCYPGGKTDTGYTLPNSVLRIGDCAISYNDHLTNLYLNEGLQSTGYWSIIRCSNLGYIGIPSTASQLDTPFARSCYNLNTIDVSDDNPWYTSVDGALFTKDMSVLVKYPSGKYTDSYAVPEGVVELAYASMDYTRILGINLPSTLETIGRLCFQGTMLEGISLPASIKTIGENAFANSQLEMFIFEGVPDTIGDYAFDVFSETITEYHSAKKVPLEDYCRGQTITYIEMAPGSVPPGIRFTLDDITYLTCYDGSHYVIVDDYKGSGGDVCIPDRVEYLGRSIPVLKIGDYAFSYSQIAGIEWPSGLRSIGDGAFSQCHGLSGTLVIPDSVEYIGSEAFFNTWFTDVVIGKGLKALGDGAFAACGDMWGSHPGSGFTVDPENPCFTTTTKPYTPGLLISKDGLTLYGAIKCMEGEIIIPPVQTISPGTFQWCEFFNGTITIPASVREIGNKAFSHVGGTEFVVENGNMDYKAVDGLLLTIDGMNLISCPGNYGREVIIPDGVETILEGAFYGNMSVSGTLVLPSSVRTVETVAFYGSWFDRVVLNDGLESIGGFAFDLQNGEDQCELVIPSSVKTIGPYAFQAIGITDLVLEGNPDVMPNGFAFNPIERVTFTHTTENDVSVAFLNLYREGYTFNGFYKDPELTVPADLTDGIDSTEMTIYAYWKLNTYTIIYELGGGVNDPSNPTAYNATMGIVILQPAVKAGSTFLGWYWMIDDDQKTRVDRIEPDMFSISDNIILLADFTPGPVEHQITFMIDGEEIFMKVLDGSAIPSMPEIAVIPGYYAFWSEDGIHEYDPDTPVTKDLTLYLVYVEESAVSGDFKVYMRSDRNGPMDIVIVSFDGLSAPRGDLTITFFYTIYDDFVEDYITAERSVSSHVNPNGEIVINILVDRPTGIGSIFSASAVFTGNGIICGSGAIFC